MGYETFYKVWALENARKTRWERVISWIKKLFK